MKKFRYLFIYLLILLIPFYVLAYDRVIPGGETIGIEVHSKGVLVVGFYKVNDSFIARESGFKVGDRIIKVNGVSVDTIEEMTREINDKNNISFTIDRNNSIKNIKMNLVYSDNSLKTGLYVKDKINGLGTLSFILEDRKFGGLGHEIMESSTAEKFEIKDGEIYDASVDGIIKSYNGSAGEKNATIDRSEVTGIITNNENTGIYGNYNGDISNREYLDIGNIEEIRVGDAYIRTVVDNTNIKDYHINILKIDKNDSTKNILFEIVDSELLNRTGGVIQGMSGSPIIQDNKMIGVVNYVLVNDPSKGFGIFLTTMLEEIE